MLFYTKFILLGVTKKNNLYKLFFGAPENKQNYFVYFIGSH